MKSLINGIKKFAFTTYLIIRTIVMLPYVLWFMLTVPVEDDTTDTE